VPAIAVVTATMQLDWGSRFFAEAEARPVVITGSATPLEARERAAEVADVVVAGTDRVDLRAALARLADRGASVVLCEGGGLLNAELVAAGVLDELCLTVAPVLGGDALRIVAPGVVPAPVEADLASVLEDDGHLFLRYLLRHGGQVPA
jgi:riboflavin biosynthesis pyrimidine reductase